MQIEYVIVHNIIKKGGKTGATLDPSEILLDVTNGDVINLVSELNDRYRTKNQSNGTFDLTKSTRFHDEFNTFISSPDINTFINFSLKTAGDLRTLMEGNAPAKGGYLVFAKYFDYRDYISVFFVRDTSGVLFKKNGNSFGINKIEHIDFEKMSMACRINKQLFESKTGRYLSFINRKSDVTSKYFTSWISTAEVETNEEDTKNLYNLFKGLTPPVDEDGKQQDKDAFLNNVYKHIVSAPQKYVSVSDLSKIYFNDENFLSDEIEKAGISINTEFKAHPAMLKRFAQIRAKASGIELIFPQKLFKSIVRINENNEGQIIIDSPELASEIAKLAN